MLKSKPFFFSLGLIILAGIFFRLYHISDNVFLFYDEGMYLGYNRPFLELVANNPPHDFNEFMIISTIMLKTALSTAKALWFLLLSLRVFFLGPQAWYFARVVSAVSGLGTVVLLFFWARRHFSKNIAFSSAFILLILPSHVFYSRLGMQEALSTLMFLGGIYLYMVKEKVHWTFFLSAILLGLVYFTNYRMIIAPVFIAFIEAFRAFTSSRKFDWTKIIIYSVSFYLFVFLVGGLYGGINNHVNLAWMFHQAQDAGGKFNPINFVSYPYYVFALEGIFFACFFWGNLYLLKLKEYKKLLPFGLVALQMLMFSFAAEKGARYLCVVLPFMACAAAVVLDDLWNSYSRLRNWTMAASALAVAGMLFLSGSISFARTDYETAVHFITDHDPQAQIVSTQPLVEGLFIADEKHIIPCPKDLYSLMELYKQGARYLVLDPQAYISWTEDGRRFSPPLIKFLEVTLNEVTPIRSFPHLNSIMLQRLVLDHNEQIMDSLTFLSNAKAKGFGEIRIYDLGSVFELLKHVYTGS